MEVSPQRLVAGDIVKVELEVAVLREMQQNHGGWNDTMASVSLRILAHAHMKAYLLLVMLMHQYKLYIAFPI